MSVFDRRLFLGSICLLVLGLTPATAKAQFSNINTVLPVAGFYSYGAAAGWGDFNNDGKLDVLIAGATTNYPSSPICEIWTNGGNGVFSNLNAGLPGMNYGDSAFADFDNDGLLDVVNAGDNGSNTFAQIWRNTGDGLFTNSNAGLPGASMGSLAWADVD